MTPNPMPPDQATVVLKPAIKLEFSNLTPHLEASAEFRIYSFNKPPNPNSTPTCPNPCPSQRVPTALRRPAAAYNWRSRRPQGHSDWMWGWSQGLGCEWLFFNVILIVIAIISLSSLSSSTSSLRAAVASSSVAVVSVPVCWQLLCCFCCRCSYSCHCYGCCGC